MKVRLLCVGGTRPTLSQAVEEYEERVTRYFRFESVEVEGGEGRTRKTDPERVKAAEAQRIAARLSDGAEVVALTREGTAWSSRELAGYLEEQGLRAVREVTFVIGGAFGLGAQVLQRADRRVSLSKMTLPHELARLVLLEQLYRAGTILRNEPYHKGP